MAALGCGTAKAKRHERSTDVRPGSTGNYSCCIYSTSALGIIANGALTSGRMELASTTASNVNNGNKTFTDNNDFNQRLNAKPDSIVFWAKAVNASNTSQSCCHLYIHDNYNLKDPLGGNPAGYESHIVGKVPAYNFTNNGSTWKRHSVAIEYDACPSNDPQFILITFSTNATPGGGAANDKLYIDDIELIYNNNLSSITVNGNPVANFNQNTTEYYVDVECGATNTISATTASPRASYTIEHSEDGKTSTIKVNHGDKQKTYIVHYKGVVKHVIYDDICQGDSYNENGFTLPIQNTAGEYVYSSRYPLENGCDSVTELVLTVNYPNVTNIDLTICDRAEYYDFHGQMITQPGTYTTTLSNRYGCDSVVILNAIFDSFYQSNISADICRGDIYEENGFYRDDEGIDTLFLQASNGCDSLVVLKLNVHNQDYIEVFDSIIAGNEYINEEYGFSISENKAEGMFTYTNTFANKWGCDSIIQLTLKVLPNEKNTDTIAPKIVTFEIYPSPTTDVINVSANYNIINESYDYQIYNIQGKLMSSGEITSRKTIVDVSKYESGYYFFKVFVPTEPKDEQKRKTVKFMVAD